jgi:hypothetical protein
MDPNIMVFSSFFPWIKQFIDHHLGCILLHLIYQHLSALTKQQQVHFPSSLLKTLSCLTVTAPRIAVGYLLLICEFHLNLIVEVNLTLENLVFNLLPLNYEVLIIGLCCNLL